MGDYWDERSRTHYERLEVDPRSSAAEIESAYRLLRAVWHPDKHSKSFRDRCSARFQGVQKAFEVLSDPLARDEYDSGLFPTVAWGAATSGPFEDVVWNNPAVWLHMAGWMKDEDSGTGFDRRMAYSAGDLLQKGRQPSQKQLPYMLKARDVALGDGYDPHEAFAA